MKIFISHISEEQPLATVIKKWLDVAFPEKLDVFVSSDPDDISAGEDWLKKIRDAMNCSDLLIILYSPQSTFRPWINFEAGCGWIKEIPIIPICHSGLKFSEIEAPISNFQGLDIESTDFTKRFFGAVTKHAEFKQASRVSTDDFMREVKSAIDSIKYKVVKARLTQEEKIKKQENIEAITAQAANKLNDPAKLEELDSDWRAHFFDKCRNVSDKDMQELWSNILSGEANAPGTYSKRTLDLVSSLDKKEAHLFTVLCSFAILDEVNNRGLLILNIRDEIYSKVGLDFWGLTQLEATGLIKLDDHAGFNMANCPKTRVYNYYGIAFKFEFRKDSGNMLEIGKVLLTESGQQLALICGSEMNSEFIGYAMEYYKGRGDVVSMTIDE